MVANIQMAVTAKTGIVTPGNTPSTRRHPGAGADPIGSQQLADAGSHPRLGMSCAPISKVMSDRAAECGRDRDTDPPHEEARPVTMRFDVSTPVFDVRELAKVYRMGEVEIHALRQVSLVLYEGHFVVLLGPSVRRRRGAAGRRLDDSRGCTPRARAHRTSRRTARAIRAEPNWVRARSSVGAPEPTQPGPRPARVARRRRRAARGAGRGAVQAWGDG